MIKYFFITIFSIFLLLSCKKYLDEKPNNAIRTPEALEDLQALLDNSSLINSRMGPSYSQASDDDYFILESTYSNSLSSNLKNAYTWIPFDYSYPNDWSRGYVSIYYSNLCLEVINRIKRTNQNFSEWNNIKGSALFFRAYEFSQLAWTFAKAYDKNTSSTDFGIVLRLTSDHNEKSKRSNVEDTYNQILKDAKEAVYYLSEKSILSTRPSRAAAYGLLARVYLSMREYDSALKYSGLCLGIKSQLLNYNTEIVSTKPTPFLKNNIETIFHAETNNTFITYSISRAKIDTILYSTYQDNDKRKLAFFVANGVYFRFKGMYTGSTSFFFSGIATDEIYLIRAECNARLGHLSDAMSDLNTLLKNRFDDTFVPVTADNLDDALKTILMERRKELLFRGLRWIDIKRLNKEGQNIILKRVIGGQNFVLSPNDNFYALPLPNDIILMTGMAQNPQ